MATYYAEYDSRIVIPSDFGDLVVPVFRVPVEFGYSNTYTIFPANGHVDYLDGVSTIMAIRGERYVVPTPTGTTNVLSYDYGCISSADQNSPIITADDYNRGSIKAFLTDNSSESRIQFNVQLTAGTRTTNYYETVNYGMTSGGLSGNISDVSSAPHVLDFVAILAMLLDSNGHAAIGIIRFYRYNSNLDTDLRIEHSRMPSVGKAGKLASITGITAYNHNFSIGSSSSSSAFIPSDADLVFEYFKVTDYVPEDPYEDFPISGEDPGNPDPDQEDDDIDEDPLPSFSFADAGFARIYAPSLSQLNDLANYMWTDSTFLATLLNHAKQILENPIESIISLNMVPCTPPVSSDVEVKVMYIGTGVHMPPVTDQFVTVDCGTVQLTEMYGSALDYNPYTKVQMYLPYIGMVQLDTDEVMGKTLHLKYNIDVVTGLCCAYLKCGSDILYQFSGHCAISQPITAADFSGYIGAALAAGKLVGAVAAAGAGAPAVAATLVGAPRPSISGGSSSTKWTERNPATGRQITAKTKEEEHSSETQGASFGEIATRGVSNTVGAVMNSKTTIQHTGGFSGNSGYIAGVRRPYLVITRPRIANPQNYGRYNGRPSMMYLNLSQCTGFTQVQSIQLTGIDATNPELAEISTLLMSGVIL